jgi:hypothetical protein
MSTQNGLAQRLWNDGNRRPSPSWPQAWLAEGPQPEA